MTVILDCGLRIADYDVRYAICDVRIKKRFVVGSVLIRLLKKQTPKLEIAQGISSGMVQRGLV